MLNICSKGSHIKSLTACLRFNGIKIVNYGHKSSIMKTKKGQKSKRIYLIFSWIKNREGEQYTINTNLSIQL